MATNVNDTRSTDSYAEVFQIVAIVIPICPIGRHRLDIQSERFNDYMRNAVTTAVGRYVRDMNEQDRMEAAANPVPRNQQLRQNPAARDIFQPRPPEPMHVNAPALDVTAEVNTQSEEAASVDSPNAGCALDLTEDTSSIVWAPPLADSDSEMSAVMPQCLPPPQTLSPMALLDRRIQFSQDAPGQRAFAGGIQHTSSPSPDALPDLYPGDSSSAISSIPEVAQPDVSVHRYPSMDKTSDLFMDAHLSRVRRPRRSSAPARVSYPELPLPPPAFRPEYHHNRELIPDVSMSEPRSTMSTDRGAGPPPAESLSQNSELMRAVAALQSCMDEPARSTLPPNTMKSVTQWLMHDDFPADLMDIPIQPLDGASANPIIISDDSASLNSQFFDVDSEIAFRKL